MLDASHYLLGSHNFSSFRSKGCQSFSPLKTLENVNVSKSKNIVKLSFLAKSFLYNQVRIMVGTLKDVGTGLISVEDMKKIINKKIENMQEQLLLQKDLFLKGFLINSYLQILLYSKIKVSQIFCNATKSLIKTFSFTLCIVFPTAPNSMTGQISLINRASDVPPVVDKEGVFPVTFLTDLTKFLTNSSG